MERDVLDRLLEETVVTTSKLESAGLTGIKCCGLLTLRIPTVWPVRDDEREREREREREVRITRGKDRGTRERERERERAVSYTHLTLPTNHRV